MHQIMSKAASENCYSEFQSSCSSVSWCTNLRNVGGVLNMWTAELALLGAIRSVPVHRLGLAAPGENHSDDTSYEQDGQPELALFYYRDLNGFWSGPELETISGYNRS